MARRAREKLTNENVRVGSKYLKSFQDALAPLRTVPAHGNREFQYHHWVNLLLLHFYNPVLNSLRALAEATDFKAIQGLVGVKHTSLGSMSESAARIFDPTYLEPIILEASRQAAQASAESRCLHLPGMPVAVDGTFLRCLPKMVWATFRRQTDHHGVRLHLHLDVQRGIPVGAEITPALGSEKKSLKGRIKPGMLYLLDRGFIGYDLYQDIHDGDSFFVARLKDNSTYEVIKDRPLTQDDRRAGVISDQLVIMGSAFAAGKLTAPVRRVVVRPKENGGDVVLLTNTDLPAEVVAELYRHRWAVELFFRWLKCILGCRNWLSLTESGLTLQVYVALLASILVALWAGRRPNRAAFRAICLYFQGWVSEEELTAHLEKLRLKSH